MQLLVVRHADAGDAEEWFRKGRPDSERPLSPKGHDQMTRVAKALRELVPDVDRIVSSPYVRAMQTAEFLQHEYGIDKLTTTETLEPESAPELFAEWLTKAGANGITAIAGHEPFLSTFVTWLIAGMRESRVRMKKAGAAFLKLDEISAGEAELLWLLTPDQLKSLSTI